MGLFALRHFERVIPEAGRWPVAFAIHSAVVGPPLRDWRRTLRPVLRQMREFHVRQAMDDPGARLSPSLPATEAVSALDREGVNALPVVEQGRVLGIAALPDLFATRRADGRLSSTRRIGSVPRSEAPTSEERGRSPGRCLRLRPGVYLLY
jgi:hypothetical protein